MVNKYFINVNMFRKIKKFALNFIKNELQKRELILKSVYNVNFFESCLYRLLEVKKNISFIQIGANDGVRFDPINKFIKVNKKNTSGIVIEPISNYFESLKITYKKYPKIKALNYAVHNTLKETIIYKVGKEHESKVPEFAIGIASFDPNHHKKTGIPSKYISKEKVKCISLNDLLIKEKILNLDVLLIDTEGYDYEILINLDFNKISPEVIHFEHGLKANTMSIKQFEKIRSILFNENYQLFIDSSDVTAYKSFLFH